MKFLNDNLKKKKKKSIWNSRFQSIPKAILATPLQLISKFHPSKQRIWSIQVTKSDKHIQNSQTTQIPLNFLLLNKPLQLLSEESSIEVEHIHKQTTPLTLQIIHQSHKIPIQCCTNFSKQKKTNEVMHANSSTFLHIIKMFRMQWTQLMFIKVIDDQYLVSKSCPTKVLH